MNCNIDFRDGVRCTDEFYQDISFYECLNLLEKLDQKEHTMLSIIRDEFSTLLIGGGLGQYIVSLFNENGSFTLKNGKIKRNLVNICAGGQYGDYAENIVFDKDLVKNVVALFWDKMESTVDWEQD